MAVITIGIEQRLLGGRVAAAPVRQPGLVNSICGGADTLVEIGNRE
ncbi:hypothetical protein [Allochromatium palmeri]|uniref:Uncharacterized protein n=1 Tax=Allochromatium palmeri TaxID=231048 RepID=A0A6N8E651_9GAMM|nr:hypothetical protein [Allochromatium palmeri]MTW19595.1 hypothetical protein [Allochromatium palmeri]